MQQRHHGNATAHDDAATSNCSTKGSPFHESGTDATSDGQSAAAAASHAAAGPSAPPPTCGPVGTAGVSPRAAATARHRTLTRMAPEGEIGSQYLNLGSHYICTR